MAQQSSGYLSTDPNAGQPLAPQYLSTDPTAGQPSAGRTPATPTAPRVLTPPPAPGTASVLDRRNWPSPGDAIRGVGRALFNTSDLGAAADTPKLIDTETAAALAGGALAASAVTAAAPVTVPAAGLTAISVGGRVAKAIPYAWRAASGAAGIAGAGAGGAGAALTEGKPLVASKPGEDSALQAALWQAGMQAAGVGGGWLFNAVGQRLLGSRVAREVLAVLDRARLAHVEDAQRILTSAQDALDAHTAARAAVRQGTQRTQRALTAEADAVRAQWPQVEGVPPTRPVPAHAPLGGSATPPPGRTGHFTLPQPRPAAARYINEQLARRDAALGREPIPAHAPPASTPPSGAPPPPSGTTPTLVPRPPGPWDANAGPPPPTVPLIPAHVPGAGGPPPPPGVPLNPTALAASRIAEVVEGPALSFKERLGAAVGEAAASGPTLNIRAVREAADQMYARTRPERLIVEGVPRATEQELLRAFSKGGGKQFGAAGGKLHLSVDDWRSILGVGTEHPLPGVLKEIQDSPDVVPFAVAHQLKRNLNDAVRWDRTAKKQLEQITKGVSQRLRATMRAADHAPYEQATTAYKDVVRLFDANQLAAQITKLSRTNPERIVNALVKVKEPTKFAMLKEVLTQHAGAGGGEAGQRAGQEAWEALQSTVMYKHLIQPGIDQFDASVAKMHPEFLQLLTGDPYAAQVFGRLRRMADAVKAVEARAAAAAQHATEATAQAGVTRTGLQRTQRRAERGVAAAKRSPVIPQPGEDPMSRLLTQEEEAFTRSSLGRPQASAGQQVGDVAYALTAPLGSPRQTAALSRILVRGPKVNDLLYWGSLTEDNTQWLINAVTSPNAPQAVAALLRGLDNLIGRHRGGGPPTAVPMRPSMSVGEKPSALTPPPGPQGR